ncbi:MAG: phage protein Gp36 family protein [Brevinema sp.]
MKYCEKHHLFEACKSSAIISWAKDEPKDDETVINNRIESAISRASDEVSLFIGKVCSLPFAEVPAVLRDIAVKLSLYQLLSRKGFAETSADNIILTNRNSALKKLDLIASGKLNILNKQEDSDAKKHILSAFPPSPYHRG